MDDPLVRDTDAGQPTPMPSARRLLAIDAARGFALLGIFLVNIRSFSEPFPLMMDPAPRERDPLSLACHYGVDGLCEGKFYVLFSFLFGIGLVLQMRNVDRSGEFFFGIYLLRLGALAAFGLIHALLLWYGDILFTYAVVGAMLMVLARYASGRFLLWIGIGTFTLGIVLATSFSVLGLVMQNRASAPTPVVAADPAKPPFDRLIDSIEAQGFEPSPTNAVWVEAEREAYRDGPFVQAFLFRLLTWALILFAEVVLAFGWFVLGAFCIGAALMKLDFFAPARRAWHRRLFAFGLLVAAPVCLGLAILNGETADPVTLQPTIGVVVWAMPLMLVAGLFLSLGYLSGLTLLATTEVTRLPATLLAAAGRMALTNYLSQTLIATFVFYYWGLAQFDSWPLPRRVAFVVLVFVGQVLFSAFWLRFFRFGPMEWLWRTITYRKFQPMRRVVRPAATLTGVADQ